jgi:murein DD-endopeptidase MepM/ murein hydrolase activator NlpD
MLLRRLAPLALMLLLATLAATAARADTFAIVTTPQGTGFTLSTPLALPTFAAPNLPGSVAVPASLSTAPIVPDLLSSTQLLDLWQRAGAAYSIPWQVLAAINKIESNFGRNMGPSSAGAIGWMQFMPSTWLQWGVDANGDGIADPWNPDDAVFSAARYLAAAGGATDLSRAVFAYNHADWYVSEVLDLANLYAQNSSTVFLLDRLQVSLDASQNAVAAASTQLAAARTTAGVALRIEARWTQRANTETLLSDRLDDEQEAGLASERASTAQALVARRSAALASAQAQLTQAQQTAAPAAFDPAASPLLDAPTYLNGYVFPVGGGPGVVSASETHHDYPAVDIAAPSGSPVYALATGVVLRAWGTPDPTCGIGLTLQTFDHQIWTYCHMADLQPGIVTGGSVTAGQSLGLVGSTGDATGPHLHLQLQPPTQWPQQEGWFQSFAGVAFSWQDSPVQAVSANSPRFLAVDTAPPHTGGPVFAIVPSTPDSSAPVVLFSRAGS